MDDDVEPWICETCGDDDCDGHNHFRQLLLYPPLLIGAVVVALILAGVIGYSIGRSGSTSSSPVATASPLISVVPIQSSVPETSTTSTSVPATLTTSTIALVVISVDEKLMIDSVNSERTKTGLSPLEWCPALARSARLHSLDMAKRDFYDHVTPEGLEVWDRARTQGYNYSYVGENIAVGQKSVKEVMIDWMNSKGHRENILLETYTHFGYGKAKGNLDGDPGYIYWTQNFGSGGTCS
jgi:uncharacterized protein YkwD